MHGDHSSCFAPCGAGNTFFGTAGSCSHIDSNFGGGLFVTIYFWGCIFERKSQMEDCKTYGIDQSTGLYWMQANLHCLTLCR